MKVECIDFSETGLFAPIFNDFVQQKEELKKFYHRYPNLEAFQEQVKEKSEHKVNREVLVEVLKSQYAQVSKVEEAVNKNIDSLGDEKTFTVTTGHQLNIFTGPLYFHFKIITVINACKQLKAKYPEYDFVPVYWMASEDHDLDEIRSVQIEGRKYKWNTEQSGAVGRMKTDGLEALAEELSAKNSIFSKAYKEAGDLADAVREYVNELYGKKGLLVLDADNHKLKSEFKAVIQNDVLNNTANELVENCSSSLDSIGYKSQSFPREINFFYLKDSIRERIVKENGVFKVLGTEIQFTEDEIKIEIENHPDRFSPNVILRPLYQETILPNLAYTGGPAEVAYWMQLKPMFEAFKTPFPILLPRNFGMIIPNQIRHKIKKLKLRETDLFTEREELKKQVTKKITAQKLNLNDERQQLKLLLSEIQQSAGVIDQSLSQMTEAESEKIRNSVDKIEKKMMSAEKRKHADKMRQIDEIKDYLFPGNGLQERKENFLPFYQADEKFIKKLMKAFDPFTLQFHIMRWDG
ncbi:bacillithiol biosynthesis cysteine-adding enzyme BshC [Marivirga harenae]|uniref:bacillithiol biosynthesis cysteine-adding enzyme BshC n=1 Tax=Marivirga harenae TaxID=2010992 RepID=UPI0026E0456A|nr:bacillithiol biosynthesis cysteine-adding enzyme BshC [Marivirga harenae]WKV12913.1 bacillithiol biosynthesis cysteine-adding enzyme BshC [Marivirga harenae]|tara:strand:- start:59412 stop:60977 length:1566 start_codon:yes stop_codon:yes gene_type:complete